MTNQSVIKDVRLYLRVAIEVRERALELEYKQAVRLGGRHNMSPPRDVDF